MWGNVRNSLPMGKRELWCWMVMALVYAYQCWNCFENGPINLAAVYDADSYIGATTSIRAFEPNFIRTPVYPAAIELFRCIFGAWWAIALGCFQAVVFGISALVLRTIAVQYTGSRRIAMAICVIYLFFTGGIDYTTWIQTEIFAITGTICLLRCMSRRGWRDMSICDFIWSGIWLLFLIFLRPISVYLIPIAAIYFGVILWRRLRCGDLSRTYKWKPAWGLACVVAIVAVLMAYQHRVNKLYKIDSISYVSTWNNFCMVHDLNLIDADEIEDEQTREIFTHIIELDIFDFSYIMWEPAPAAHEDPEAWYAARANAERYITDKIRENKGAVAKYLATRTVNVMAFFKYTPKGDKLHMRPINNIMAQPFGLFLLFMMWVAWRWLKQWRMSRQIPLETGLFIAVSLGICAASIIGAMYDYERLFYPGLPATLLLGGKMCTLFSRNGNNL